jgi:hypothetical protein
LGGEQPEGNEGKRDPDGCRDQDIGWGVGAKGDAAEPGQRHERGCDPFAGVAPTALRHHRVQDPHQQGREQRDLERRHPPAAPAGPDDHPERSWPLGDRGQPGLDDQGQQLRQDHHHDQVPEPPEHQQRHQQHRQQAVDDPPGADHRQPSPGPDQPRRLQSGQPVDHRVVDDGHVHGQAAHAAGEGHDRQHHQHAPTISHRTPLVCR